MDEHARELKERYIALRSKVFLGTYPETTGYKGGADSFDARENTVYIIGVDDADHNKVVAGARFMISNGESGDRLRFEKVPHLQIENILPHIDTSGLRYVELGGVAADPPGTGAGTKIQEYALQMFKDNKIDADVFAALMLPSNVGPLTRSVQTAGIDNVAVREDLIYKKGDVPRILVMAARDSAFPLLSEDMKQRGVGTPPNEFYLQMKQGMPAEKRAKV